MIKGWVEDSGLSLEKFIEQYNETSIRGFVFTDISRDGMLQGLDISFINEVIKKTNKNIIVGGGLSNYGDLYNLKKIKTLNLEGAIAGKAFYSGKIEILKALKIFKQHA